MQSVVDIDATLHPPGQHISPAFMGQASCAAGERDDAICYIYLNGILLGIAGFFIERG
jgi:hypothetical protein